MKEHPRESWNQSPRRPSLLRNLRDFPNKKSCVHTKEDTDNKLLQWYWHNLNAMGNSTLVSESLVFNEIIEAKMSVKLILVLEQIKGKGRCESCSSWLSFSGTRMSESVLLTFSSIANNFSQPSDIYRYRYRYIKEWTEETQKIQGTFFLLFP